MSSQTLQTAIVLAGGQGNRLRPLTDSMPKPMVPIVEHPLLEHIVLGLREQGITRIALATGYKAEQISEHFGNGSGFGVECSYFIEDEPLGSGGAVRNIAQQSPELLQSTFVVATADVLHDVNFACALALHREQGALATIVCSKVADQSGFGICEMEPDGRVQRFLEKPPPGVTESQWANLGLWIFEPAVLALIPPGSSRIEDQLFPAMLQRRLPLFAYRHEGYWLDVGTMERYRQAQQDAVARKFPLAP
jgi:NDP-sugar pyrophosphorylase family protein